MVLPKLEIMVAAVYVLARIESYLYYLFVSLSILGVIDNKGVIFLCDFQVPYTLFYLFGAAEHASNFDCILNCDQRSISVCLPEAGAYLHLPIVVCMQVNWNMSLLINHFCIFLLTFVFSVQNSKLDRFSLFNNLPSAVSFAKLNLTKGRTLLICCHDGKLLMCHFPNHTIFYLLNHLCLSYVSL